jgi:hypothetical protein
MNHLFHPLVWQWFAERFGKATAAREASWESIAQGNDTLIAAPTGSGKPLAAFFWSIDRLIRRAVEGRLEDKTSVVYVSPLKALENDIQKNLQEPLSGILSLMGHQGVLHPDIRVAVRSGDTPSRERQLTLRPPHILIATPESLYILLTAQRSGYAAAERLDRVRSAFPNLEIDAPTGLPSGIRQRDENSPADHAIGFIIQGWTEVVGPVTVTTLAQSRRRSEKYAPSHPRPRGSSDLVHRPVKPC